MSKRIEVLEGQLFTNRGPHICPERVAELRETVKKMTSCGKGLLAADESVGSVTKRFDGLGLENNAENRRRYRALMIGAEGLEKYISGVIFFEETLGQRMEDGSTFPEYCTKRGIVPGVKTDGGLADAHEGAPGEQITQGLDNYTTRAEKYYKLGARFCKWRNVYKIQAGTVSQAIVDLNAQTLARYAVLSQAAGLVPIVEPEVMLDGDHTIEDCFRVSERVWFAVMSALHQHGVLWEYMLLKCNMICPGAESGVKATPCEVASRTVKALSRTLPAAVPGVMFLSGGLSEVQASEYLHAMNTLKCIPRPWVLSFSYARALQTSALHTWAGKDENVAAARKVFLHRAKMNSQAAKGEYVRVDDDKESESLYVKGHTY